jgi:hypothetical protein
VEGFARIAESDMYLVPDLSTFAVIPWEMDLSTARVICDVYTPDGTPFGGDPRYVLKRQLARAAELGLDYFVGPELEFFLFKPHSDGSLLPLQPHDEASYFDISTDLAHSVRRQMVDALQAMGIDVEASHHEVAPARARSTSAMARRWRPPTTPAPSAPRSRLSPRRTVCTAPSCPNRWPGSTVRACMSIRACGAATTARPQCTTPRATMA